MHREKMEIRLTAHYIDYYLKESSDISKTAKDWLVFTLTCQCEHRGVSSTTEPHLQIILVHVIV